MQNKITLHEVCAKRTHDPETITALLRDANKMPPLPPELHQIAADTLETVLRCCEQNSPRRDFIEIGSATIVKLTAILLANGLYNMVEQSEARSKLGHSQKQPQKPR